MDGEQSFTSMGQALDAAVARREPEAQPSHTNGNVENGSQPSHTPDEGTSSTSSGKSGPSKPANGDTSGQTTATKTANQGGENAGRTNNFHSAARRIRQRANDGLVQRRIEKLAQEREELLKTGDEQSIVLAHQKGSEIENLQALQADQAYEQWADRAFECFGDSYKQFLDMSERYGEYVNKNEPGLVTMIDRPYGLYLYADWMRQMENGDFRTRWVGMTQFEKEAVLNNVYQQIVAKAEGPGVPQQQAQPQGGQATPQAPQSQTPPQQKIPDVPTPGSGRESNQFSSPNSFGEALNNALAKRGISNF